MKIRQLLLFTILFLSSCAQLPEKQTNTQNVVTPPVTSKISGINHILDECKDDSTCINNLTSWIEEKLYPYNAEDSIEPEDNQISEDIQKPIVNLSSDLLSNELVKGAINEWLTWKRPQLINTWQYYQYLKKDIKPPFEKLGVSEALMLAIMAQESGGRVHSNSKAGAGGIFQLMPATAKRLGIAGYAGAFDKRYNPKFSAQAAAQYLYEQKHIYNNDLNKVLAAYNGGENRIARLNKKHKNISIWEKNFYYDLPRETRNYLPSVLSAMLIFSHPNKFNVELKPIDEEIITVKLNQTSSLSELAICLGQQDNSMGWFRVIRNLNSGIRADKTFPAQTELKIPQKLLPTFNSKCNDQNFMSFAQKLHIADFKSKSVLLKYKIRKGDSLSRIAKKFRCTSKREIAKINKITAPRYLIRVGKYLKIPQC